MTLRWVPDPEAADRTTPAYGDCDCCRGHGTVIGGDEPRPCPACLLKLRREYGPFVDALAGVEG